MDNNIPVKLPKDCKLLAEFDKHVLAERTYEMGENTYTEYVTWSKGYDSSVSLGHYYRDDLKAAKEDFVKRSGLVNEAKIFNPDELAVLYKALAVYEGSGTIDYADKNLCEHIENIREKLERIPDVDLEKYFKINVLILEPYKPAYEKKVNCDLYSYSDEIGGHAEDNYPFMDTIVLISNRHGEETGLPFNRIIGGQSYYGNLIIAATNDSCVPISLAEEQKKEYMEMFNEPESKDRFKQVVDSVVRENELPIRKDDEIER